MMDIPVARVEWLARASTERAYNAFTALKLHGGCWWLAYRTGKGHVSPRGKIVVRTATDPRGFDNDWEVTQVIEQEGLELRDPHLYVISGELYLLCFSLRYDGFRILQLGDSFIYKLHGDGQFRLETTFDVNAHGDLLWALAESKEGILATGYKFADGHPVASLWRVPGLGSSETWERLVEFDDSFLPPNMGISEVDVLVEKDGTLSLFYRVDRDSKSRAFASKEARRRYKQAYRQRKEARQEPPCKGHQDWFATAVLSPPFTGQPETRVHRMYVKGPRAIEWPSKDARGHLLVCRHKERAEKDKSVSLFYHEVGKLTRMLEIARGKDGSYAGLQWIDPGKKLMISFYSDHDRIDTITQGRINDVWIALIDFTGEKEEKE